MSQIINCSNYRVFKINHMIRVRLTNSKNLSDYSSHILEPILLNWILKSNFVFLIIQLLTFLLHPPGKVILRTEKIDMHNNSCRQQSRYSGRKTLQPTK